MRVYLRDYIANHVIQTGELGAVPQKDHTIYVHGDPYGVMHVEWKPDVNQDLVDQPYVPHVYLYKRGES